MCLIKNELPGSNAGQESQAQRSSDEFLQRSSSRRLATTGSSRVRQIAWDLGHRGRASPRDELGAVAATCGRSSFSPVMPPACHKQRSRAVSSGQSRPVNSVVGLANLSLTWGGGAGRNCMACKGSGVQIPSAPPPHPRSLTARPSLHHRLNRRRPPGVAPGRERLDRDGQAPVYGR
jgi:hypothetical protein